ncbi:MAG TPA: hypothetical protein VJO34_16075 [Methylomirabilota bacterium]|nr:hypothetical protein [Methylomirabilota bacterium]
MSKSGRDIQPKDSSPWRREEDPFRNAKPLADLKVLLGGLPDNRDPEEILRDLRAARPIRPLHL